MEEQAQYQPAAKPKSDLAKIILINILISAIISVIASYAVVSVSTGGLTKRVSTLEQTVGKISSKFIIK